MSHKPLKSKKDTRLIIICLSLIIIIIPGIYMIRQVVDMFHDPTIKVLYGLYQRLEDKEPEFYLNVKNPDPQMDSSFYNYLNYDVYGRIKEDGLEMSLDASINKTSLFNAHISYKDSVIYMKEHSMKNPAMMNNSSYETYFKLLFDGHYYFQYIDIKGFYLAKYAQVFSESMSQHIKVNENNITIKLDIFDLLNTTSDLLIMAKDDAILKKKVKKSLVDIFEHMEEDHYHFLTFDQNNWQDALVYMKDNYDDDYEERIATISNVVKDLRYAFLLLPFDEPSLSFDFDGNDLIHVTLNMTLGDHDWQMTLGFEDVHMQEEFSNYASAKQWNQDEFLDTWLNALQSKILSDDQIKSIFMSSQEFKDYQATYGIKTVEDYFRRLKLNRKKD